MKDKIALVTGGMGCIGTAICRNFIEQGAIVIASYYRGGDHEAANFWREEQLSHGYDINIRYVDVADFHSSGKLIKKIEAEFQRIDILINNAGIVRDVPLYKMDAIQWQEVLRTNLDSMFNITRHVINGMIARKYGRIINVSSINGQKGQFGQTNYSASKAGIHGFTKSLAQEVACKGITVNTISPGYIETPMVMALAEEIRDSIISEIPVGRLGTSEEVARAISFLAASSSGYITGANLTINGGHYLTS